MVSGIDWLVAMFTNSIREINILQLLLVPETSCEDVLVNFLFFGAKFVEEALEHAMVNLVYGSSIRAFLIEHICT